MSVDTYFCFCCLSTDDLTNLFGDENTKNYCTLLKDLFSIRPLQEHYEYDSQICAQCAERLTDAHKFKTQVMKTLTILQGNGLIELRKKDGELLIRKATEIQDDKYDIDVNWKTNKVEDKVDDHKLDIIPTFEELAQQEIKLKHYENTKIVQGIDIIRPILTNDPVKMLKRKMNITDEVNAKKKSKVPNDLKCHLCGHISQNAYTFHVHFNKHFPNVMCDICGKNFSTKSKLLRHMLSHKRGLFPCKECDRSFIKYNSYCAHKQRKHATRPAYLCGSCPARFDTVAARARHRVADHGVPDAVRCHLCDATFMTQGYLKTHLRCVHEAVKRYFCDDCDAGFFHKQDLVGHISSHTGVNAFKCHLCTKSYPRKNALRVHIRTHTDDKRFGCDNCGVKFIQKSSLITHLKTHNRRNSSLNDNSTPAEDRCIWNYYLLEGSKVSLISKEEVSKLKNSQVLPANPQMSKLKTVKNEAPNITLQSQGAAMSNDESFQTVSMDVILKPTQAINKCPENIGLYEKQDSKVKKTEGMSLLLSNHRNPGVAEVDTSASANEASRDKVKKTESMSQLFSNYRNPGVAEVDDSASANAASSNKMLQKLSKTDVTLSKKLRNIRKIKIDSDKPLLYNSYKLFY